MTEGTAIVNKKVIRWTFVPLCLLLVFMGMRVPALGKAPSTPKPRPRAIIESSYKNSQDASVCDPLLVQLRHNLPAPLLVQPFPTSPARESSLFGSVALSRPGARAPPQSIC
jgi:hypothetical protein